MKKCKIITTFFVLSLSFFICIMLGTSGVKAANCGDGTGDVIGKLNNIKCTYAKKVSSLSYITEYQQGLITNQFSSEMSLSQSDVVNNEGIPAGTGASFSDNPYNTENAYKAWDSYYPDIYYYYGVHDKGRNIFGHNATNVVRGTDAIIFPAKYPDNTAYNKQQYYKVCEKKRLWGLLGCKTWSSYKLGKEAYGKVTGKYDSKTGKVEFTDLSNVTMVLPSFQINLGRSDYNSSTGTYNMAGFDRRFDLISAAYYIGKDKYIYAADGKMQRDYGRGVWLDDNVILHNYYKSQALFNTLVMEYKTKIYYYYTVGSCSNGLCKVQKAVANATLYVSYRVANNSDQGYFAALNGWFDDEGAPATGISLIPIHYDVSMILDPTHWTNGSCTSADNCTEMFVRESLVKAGTVTFNGNSVVKGATQTDVIKVRAVGLDTDPKINNIITLDVTGQFYYKHDVELVEGLSVAMSLFENASATTATKTTNITSEIGTAKLGTSNTLALNTTWGITSKRLVLDVFTGGFDVSNLKIYQVNKEHYESLAMGRECTFKYVQNKALPSKPGGGGIQQIMGVPLAAAGSNTFTLSTTCKVIKEDANGNSYETTSTQNATQLSSQTATKKDGKKVYSYDMSPSTALFVIAVMKMNASNEYIYVPMAIDPVKPKNIVYDGTLLNGTYIVTQSLDEAKNLACRYEENVAPVVGGSCSITLMRDGVVNETNPNTVKFVYTDWIGLVGESSEYALIIDDKNPDSMKGTLRYELQTEDLDGGTGNYSTDLNVPSFNMDFLSFDQTLNVMNELFADIENDEDFKPILDNLGMYEVLLTDPRARASVTIKAYDPGTYGADSSGIAGFFYKMWNIGEESVASWSYHLGDEYEITGLTGDTYVALMSIDNAKRFYNPTGTSGTFIKVYKISMYSIPYVNEVIATERGLSMVVRDDLDVYKDSSGISTHISNIVLVDTEAGTNMYNIKTAASVHEQDYFKDVIYNPTVYGDSTPITLSQTYSVRNRLKSAVIGYDESKTTTDYVEDFTGTYLDYGQFILSSNIQSQLNGNTNINIDTATFDNMMLINGLILNGHSQIYIEYIVVEPTRQVTVYQMVSVPSTFIDEVVAKKFSFYNEMTDHEISSANDVLAITGNDYNSTKDGDDFVLNYKYYTYYSEEPIAGTLTETADGTYYRITTDSGEVYILYKSFYTCVEEDGKVICLVNEGQYNIYYKICYETEGSFGATVSCHGDRYLYREEDGVVLGQINENVVYHVYTAIMTGVEWDSTSNQLIAKFNNDDSNNYRVVTPNENILNTNRVIDGEYEIDYCRFLYATAIPEITIEYVTRNEYNPDGINKLKDPGWVTGSKNYIIKVTLNYEVDKFKKDPDEWMTLTADDISWFAYYEATGRSVCGNVDRMECDQSMTSFGLYDASSRSGEYTPRVYYLQYPTTEDINEFDLAYSVDVFDLVIKLQGNNGLTNEGMDLVVDGVTREENKDFLTIYYDQDGPNITITSSPDKDPEYYAVSIAAKDVSSNVAKISFYYGKITPEGELDPEAFLLYEEEVNQKEFTGYSAKLTQKGWYTVIAEDEFGQMTCYSFEVVKLEDGVMFSPTLDDTDQIQDNDEDQTKVMVTIIASVLTIFVALVIIGIIIVACVIYFKYGKAIKMGKKAVKKAKPIAKYTKNAGGWVGAASKVVDAIPDEAVEEKPKPKPEEQQNDEEDE